MGTPTTPSSDVCVTATGLSRLRKAATRRAVPALLLPSVPPGGLPPTAPTREPRSPRAAAWPSRLQGTVYECPEWLIHLSAGWLKEGSV